MDDYQKAYAAEAVRHGYHGAKLIDGVWCVDGQRHPGTLRDAPPGAPAHMRAIPGTDQMRIGRIVDAAANKA